MMRTSYKEGDWLYVPLSECEGAVGRVVRANPRAGVLLGCFFGPRLKPIPVASGVEGLMPELAILVARFGHLGLAKGIWPRICSSPLRREDWPIPRFVRRDLVSGTDYLVTYEDD